MQGLNLLENEQWLISSFIGIDHPFLAVNVRTVVNTWILLGILFIACLLARFVVRKKGSVGQYIALSYVRFFVDLCKQALGPYALAHIAFITTLFTFILFGNTLSVIPWLEEPTTDLNTTLCLGLISFIYTQAVAIYTHGIKAYIKEYFQPFFILFPLHVVGKIAAVISISFRLFGNIFGGAIITSIYTSAIQGTLLFELFGLFTGINLIITLFFSIFEGFLQAFVFSMLSLTYLSIALQGEEDE